jgi:signal transduction histidine kinase
MGGKKESVIEIGGEREGVLLRFYVRDHGAGIQEQERPRIFDIFYRGSNGEKMSGTRLGLATVKRIVQLYKRGRIWVDETEGGGSTFGWNWWIQTALTESKLIVNPG